MSFSCTSEWLLASRSVVQHIRLSCWDLGTKLLPVFLVKWFSIHTRELFFESAVINLNIQHLIAGRNLGTGKPEKITHRYAAPWIIHAVSLLWFPKYPLNICTHGEKSYLTASWDDTLKDSGLETTVSQMNAVWYSTITWRPSKCFWKEKICPARLELISEVFSKFPFIFCLAPSPAGGRDLTILNCALCFK